jgi:hypothetical protein
MKTDVNELGRKRDLFWPTRRCHHFDEMCWGSTR